MAGKYVLGIDVGTSGCKILALDDTGKILGTAVEEYPLYSPQAGWSEQDPEDWWNGVVQGIQKVMASINDKEICAVGLSGQMHGMIALDKENKVLRRAILWNDQRTQPQCDEITKLAGGLDSLLSLTNNQMMTGFTGGKILWMKQNEPENYEKTAVILNPKDYIRFRLSSEYITEVSDASGTGLFDIKNRRWSAQLIEKIGLDIHMLPKVVESTEEAGRVSRQAEKETGIPAGTIIAGGGGDAVISTTGLGLIQPGRVGITLGTSGVVAMGLPNYMENPKGILQVSCNNAPGTYHVMGVTLAAAGSYQWFRNALGQLETELGKALQKSAFALLDAQAMETPPCADGLIFLPYLTGERAPINDPNSTGAFLGITSRHGKGHFARAVMEGVAFSLRQVNDLIMSVQHDVRPNEIVLAGGGANSRIWRQIFADLFDLPVRTVYGSAEGGSFGAALVAGVAGGLWKNLEGTVAFIRTESETLPHAEASPLYQTQYEKYIRYYDALKWSY